MGGKEKNTNGLTSCEARKVLQVDSCDLMYIHQQGKRLSKRNETPCIY